MAAIARQTQKMPARTKSMRHSHPVERLTELPALSLDAESFSLDFRRYYSHTLGRDKHCRSVHYPYEALSVAIRDRLMQRWKNTFYAYYEKDCRRAHYLSLEFLMGRTLGNAMLNLGVTETVDKAMHDLGISLEELVEAERDAGLGNGGLGRLAACFLDSCATLQLPVMGYGIRYEYGMFRQRIENGFQVEEPDHWLRDGNPWELERPEYTRRIHYYGRTEHFHDEKGEWRVRWVDTHDVLAVPYDIPIPGYRNGTVNTLRLWSAAATDEFNLGEFNAGSYPESVAAKNDAEHITMVLYPNDASENGKELRLRQQYFLASATLQDVVRQWQRFHGNDFQGFAEKNCFHLNDTHPSIAVAELMRLLLDVYGMGWDEAWGITSRTMAYTNHTLLPEALERWPVRIFGHLLPRLLEVIYEINARFLAQVSQRWPEDHGRLQRMSIIEEGAEPQVRMAYLAIVGSCSVNGVAELHSRLLREGLFRDFYELWPEKFNNKTNGVTQRRWLAGCNRPLSRLITDTIGEGWVTDLNQLSRLALHAEEGEFRERWREARRRNKVRLADYVRHETGAAFDPDAMFDTQVKRIHEYKRQLLNALHIIHLYLRVKDGQTAGWTPRCVLFGGKAAPGYAMAKLIIKLINNLARVVNDDRAVTPYLQVAFIPDYGVSSMEVVCPGTDLSEQLSTAGKEASGTGNMKFMMNGAVTIGTLDGANIEILEAVGADNFFLFGLTAQEVESQRWRYDPEGIISRDEDLRRIMDLLRSGHFNRFEPGLFDPILQAITSPQDPWMIAADFHSFLEAQRRASLAYQDPEQWTRMSIANTAASGRFSTDRTIAEYAREIWRIEPVTPLPLR
jgi:starch phosphorylase